MVSAYMCITDGRSVIVGVKRNCCFWMKGGGLNPAFVGKKLPLVGGPPSSAYYVYQTGIPITNNPEQNVFPGGRMERLESGKHAAMREWLEEMGEEAIIPTVEFESGISEKLDNLFHVHYVKVSTEQLTNICLGANNVLKSSRRDWFRDKLLRTVFDGTHTEFYFNPPLYSDEIAEAKIYSIVDILSTEVFNVNEHDEKLSGSYFLSIVRNLPSSMLAAQETQVESVEAAETQFASLQIEYTMMFVTCA